MTPNITPHPPKTVRQGWRQPAGSRLGALAFLLILAALMAGCNFQRERSIKVHPDWSRGQLVGRSSVRQPVALAADDSGAYLLWSARVEDATRLNFGRTNVDGTLAFTQTVPLKTFFPRLPQMVAGPQLHAFVITRLNSGEENGIYHFELDRSGQLLGEAERLSAPEQSSDILSVVEGPGGTMDVLWDVTDGPGPGVYHVALDAEGESQGFPQLVDPGGEQPAGRVDADGRLHAAWLVLQGPTAYELRYTVFEPGQATPGEAVVVARVRIPTSDVTQPLTLGLDQTHVYVLWSQEHRSGLTAGNAELFLVAFPIGRPELATESTVFVSQRSDPLYRNATGYTPLSSVALPSEEADWSSFVEGPVAVAGQQPLAMLPVLVNLTTSFRFDDRAQVALLIFQDGQFMGHQFPARTTQYSQRPQGTVTDDGNMHISWIDLQAPGAYSVYYASTDPEVKAVLDQQTANDRYLDALDTAWGIASAFSLIPLLAMVFLPVLLASGIFYLSGVDDSLRQGWAARLALVVIIVLYLGAKIFMMTGLVARPPLLNQVPAAIQPIWWLIALLAVASLAGLALLVYIRRSQRPFLFRAILTFALLDALLTLIVYGPSFFGE